MKKENKKELLFLEDMGFDEEHIGEIKDLFVQETIDTLNENSETVKKNDFDFVIFSVNGILNI